ncbi:hypothetical protein ACB092_09G157500 [Castanea dentata]
MCSCTSKPFFDARNNVVCKPEQLFHRKCLSINSEALARTRGRGRSTTLDLQVELDLLSSPKDHLEFTIVRESIPKKLKFFLLCQGCSFPFQKSATDVGRERNSAFCLMQKYVDLKSLGTKLQIISAFALDHIKGCIYIEADKQFDIIEPQQFHSKYWQLQFGELSLPKDLVAGF